MTNLNSRKILRYAKKRAGLARLSLFSLTGYTPSPRRLIVEITDNCNLNCPICPRSFTTVKEENMPLEKFKHILDQMPRVREVDILGRGEPFLHPELFEILAFSKSRNIQLQITTNGILLTDKNIKRLENVSAVYVSIDSPNPETYKKLRGANLEIIKRNVKRLKELKREIYVVIQALLMEDNIEELPEFIYFTESVDADQLSFLHPIAFDRGYDKKRADNSNVLNLTRKIKEMAKGKGINFEATHFPQKPRPCFEPWHSPRISLHGDIYPCCYIYNSAEPTYKEWFYGVMVEVPQHQYRMGNIFEDSFNKIWNGSSYKLLRRAVRESKARSILPPQELNQRRREINLSERFSYCQVCLWRQRRAC